MPRNDDTKALLSESESEASPPAEGSEFQRKELSSSDDVITLWRHTLVDENLQTTDEMAESCAQLAKFLNSNKELTFAGKGALEGFLKIGYDKKVALEEVIALEDTAHFKENLPPNPKRAKILDDNGIYEKAITGVKKRWGVPFVIPEEAQNSLYPPIPSPTSPTVVASTKSQESRGLV